MKNKYVLIINLMDETKNVYKKQFETENYEILIDEKNTILAKKVYDNKINIEHEKLIIKFIKCMANKYEKYGVIYIDLTEVIYSILKNIENIKEIKYIDNNITLPIRQAIMRSISQKEDSLN